MPAINPDRFLILVVNPVLGILSRDMARDMATDEARVLLLAIALQESRFEYRRQVGGPARGFWQFESGGGVYGVMKHSSSAGPAEDLCGVLQIPWVQTDVFEALAWNDALATGFARLLLYTDPNPLPKVGETQAAWDYYLRNWRPGKPHPETWAACYQQATDALQVTRTTVPAGEVPVAVVPVRPLHEVKDTPGTLVTDGVKVDLPAMPRSWRTGEFWVTVGSTLGTALILLGPLLDPMLDHVATNPMLLSIPGGAAIFAVARSWYKAQRVRYAAEVAAAATKN